MQNLLKEGLETVVETTGLSRKLRFDPLSSYIILPLCIAYATSRKAVISKTLFCIPAA